MCQPALDASAAFGPIRTGTGADNGQLELSDADRLFSAAAGTATRRRARRL
jgi:hypothetical protein